MEAERIPKEIKIEGKWHDVFKESFSKATYSFHTYNGPKNYYAVRPMPVADHYLYYVYDKNDVKAGEFRTYPNNLRVSGRVEDIKWEASGASNSNSSNSSSSESANSGQEAEGVWGFILVVIDFVRFLFSPLYKMRYFKEPAARAEWWLTVLGVVVRFFIVGVIMGFGGAQDDSYLILLAVALLPLVVISLRRVRDAGKPWWWAFVPAANVILCGFFPSGAGETGAVNAIERGADHLEKGNYDKAVADFNKAIRLAPDEADIYVLRGQAHYEKGDYDSALADLGQAIRLDPNDAVSYKIRADVYSDMEKYDLAIADLDQLIRLEGENAEAYRGRGNMNFLKNEHDRAITDYDQAIRVNPNDSMAYKARADVYLRKSENDIAIAGYDQAIRLNPEFTAAYSNRGLAYAEKGDLDRAIADFDRIIRLDPKGSDGAWAYAKRGLAYADKGDFDRTISDFETVLRLNPNDEEAAAILERARQMKKGQG